MSRVGARGVAARRAVFGLGCLSLVALVALVAIGGAALGGRAEQADLMARLQGPSAAHLLGTDHLGRDVLARVLHGATVTVALAAVVLVGSAAVGTAAGMVAGRAPGVLRAVVLTVTDTTLAVPSVAVALAVAAATGPGPGGLVLALCLVGWTPFCRLAFQHTNVVMAESYIEAARAIGCSPGRLLVGHVLPNVASPLLGHAAARFGHTVIAISALSYLGLGPQPPSAEWGAMVAVGQPYIERAPLATAAPALAIGLTAIAAQWVGRAAQERLDVERGSR